MSRKDLVEFFAVTLSYFIQVPYHPFFIVIEVLQSRIIGMHIFIFFNRSVFYNNYFRSVEQGVFRRQRIYQITDITSVALEKYEIVNKYLN